LCARLGNQMSDENFSAEFLLTAACCRWPPSAARDSLIRSVAQGGIDWAEFLRLARRHRIGGLAQRALESTGADYPPNVMTALTAAARQIARQNLQLATEAARLAGVIESAGIPVFLLKGVALAQLAYGSIAIKHTRDIDLLVPVDAAEAAWRIVERAGYTAIFAQPLSAAQRSAFIRSGREAEFVHRDTQARVELQWQAAINPQLLQNVDARSPAQTVTLSDGANVRTLARDDLFAYLCTHGAQHAWSRLKWLADLNALIAASQADVERLYLHAQSIGAGLCAGQALLLCRRLFDLDLPPPVAEEIAASFRTKRLVTIACNAMTAVKTQTEADPGFVGVIRGVGMQFLLGRGWAYFAAQCRIALVGPMDVVRWPLPRSLYFVYPLLRLPLWLKRRVTQAAARKP
jgi:hypothetical protein